MIWFVYDHGNYIGTVIAVDEDDALAKAEEKFACPGTSVCAWPHFTVTPRGR